MFFSFPFHGARTRLDSHLCLDWHPRCPVPRLISLHTSFSFSLIPIAPLSIRCDLNMAQWQADEIGEQGEQTRIAYYDTCIDK
jgi:hypothetical protein